MAKCCGRVKYNEAWELIIECTHKKVTEVIRCESWIESSCERIGGLEFWWSSGERFWVFRWLESKTSPKNKKLEVRNGWHQEERENFWRVWFQKGQRHHGLLEKMKNTLIHFAGKFVHVENEKYVSYTIQICSRWLKRKMWI